MFGRHLKSRLALALGALCLVAGGSTSRADINVTLPSVVTTPYYGNNYQTFLYTADLTAGTELKTGNFFTIYDIPGLFSATAPTGWTATAAHEGVTMAGVNVVDDVNLLNVTYTYTGATTLVGPQNLGTFNIVTDAAHAGVQGGGVFAAQATNISTGGLVNNTGTLLLPAATGTPLPAGAYAALPALALVGMMAKRKVAKA